MSSDSRRHLQKNCELFGLDRSFRSLLEIYSPEISLETYSEPLEEIPLGETRIGGIPDLPEDLPWPSTQGKHLSFLGQLRVSEIRNFDEKRVLPKQGFLYFFVDLEDLPDGQISEDASKFQVLFCSEEKAKLVRTSPPKDSLAKTLNSFSVEYYPRASLPPEESPEAQNLNLSVDDWDRYYDLTQELERIDPSDRAPKHKFLGYSDLLQGDLRLDCELIRNGLSCRDEENFRSPKIEKYETGLSDWQLIFQIDQDEELGPDWRPPGRIYFMAPKEALRNGRLEESWMVLQEGGV